MDGESVLDGRNGLKRNRKSLFAPESENSIADERRAEVEWKKEQRMIRNRESAARSRKRRRDRSDVLECEVLKLQEEKEELSGMMKEMRRVLEEHGLSHLVGRKCLKAREPAVFAEIL